MEEKTKTQDEKKAEKKEEKKVEKKEEKKAEKKAEKKNEKDYSLFSRVVDKSKEQEKTIRELEQTGKIKFKMSKTTKIAIGVGILILILGIISTIFSLVAITNDNIVEGVSIAGVDVSKMSKNDAQEAIEKLYAEKKEKDINLKYQDYENSLNPTMMGVDYKIKEAVDEAFSIGRGGNIFVSNYEILFALLGRKNIDVNMEFDKETTRQSIQDMGVDLPGVVEESSYYVEENQLIISKGKKGVVIDTDGLLSRVENTLKDVNTYNTTALEIPVTEKEPEPIDIQKIHDEICVEAQDAYILEEPFEVHPEVEGISFDVEEAKKILEEEKEEYIINLTITKPKVTLSQMGNKAFPHKLGTCQTRYDVSDTDRTKNLEIACQKINGKIILPGETFSYNKTLGPRTEAAGFRNGKIYSAGEVVDGIGGGICQISSTLYNAALLANLEIVERRNHQFVTSYLEEGRDATVVYGAIDFKFKNTRTYPIKIQASANAGIATVSIYGIKEEKEYTFKFETKVIATIPMQTKYEEDSSKPIGTEEVKQKGAAGKKTETYITKYYNGVVVERKLLSKDTYDAMPRIIVKGTGKAATTSEPSNTNERNTQTQEPVAPQPSTAPVTPPVATPSASPEPSAEPQASTSEN